MRPLNHYIQVGRKRLRCGYTTGTCAAAAARAAAELLLTGAAPTVVCVETPSGIPVEVEVEEARLTEAGAECAVRKDGGDDPDITDGILIAAVIRKQEEPEISIDGGEGVGRVTRAGLDQPIGSAAINSVPRSMIREQAAQAALAAHYLGGLAVTISIPEGEKLSEKTFNPRLGIQGGLSVLGTSGIVRPMSEAALIASIHAEMDVKKAEHVGHLLVSPGNYGAEFCRSVLGLELSSSVQCSNYIGDTLDYAACSGFKSLLLVGHIGKLVKCAAGVMNTHSRTADARMETFAAYAALNGADRDTIQRLMESVTTDGAVELLKEKGILEPVMAGITSAAAGHLRRRAGDGIQVETILFSNRFGLLGQSEGAEQLLAFHRKEE